MYQGVGIRPIFRPLAGKNSQPARGTCKEIAQDCSKLRDTTVQFRTASIATKTRVEGVTYLGTIIQRLRRLTRIIVLPNSAGETKNSRGARYLEIGFLGWANLVIYTAEVAALGVVILLLLRVHRNIAALLRVTRRIDRKTADTTRSSYWRQAELNEAELQWTGDREQEPDRPAAGC